MHLSFTVPAMQADQLCPPLSADTQEQVAVARAFQTTKLPMVHGFTASNRVRAVEGRQISCVGPYIKMKNGALTGG